MLLATWLRTGYPVTGYLVSGCWLRMQFHTAARVPRIAHLLECVSDFTCDQNTPTLISPHAQVIFQATRRWDNTLEQNSDVP